LPGTTVIPQPVAKFLLGVSGMLERLFSLKEHRTVVSQEVIAGLTTFAAMAYILAVNPSILSTTGMDKGAKNFLGMLPVVLSILFVDLFDNMGTLIGVSKRAGLLDKDGTCQRLG
jgi:xanthine/uracil/vitamin C permease (AzgA family)